MSRSLKVDRDTGYLVDEDYATCGCWYRVVSDGDLTLEAQGELCDRHFQLQHEALEEMTTEQIPMDL